MKARSILPLALLLALSAPTAEPERVVVTSSSPAGWHWTSSEGAAGGFAREPAQPPLGEGSAFFRSEDGGAVSLGADLLAGTPLARITELSYGTFSTDGSTVSLQLRMTYQDDPGGEHWLTYTPPASSVAKDEWQTWDAHLGLWSFPIGYAYCAFPEACTWGQLLGYYAQLSLAGGGDTLRLALRGNGSASADALSIAAEDKGSSIFDFEPDAPPQTVYVDPQWADLAPGTDPDGEGPALSLDWDAFAAPQEALQAVAPGGTAIVAAADYPGPLSIDRTLALVAEEGAVLGGEAGGSALSITAADVSVQGLGIMTSGGTAVALEEGASATLKGVHLEVRPGPSGGPAATGLAVGPGAALTVEESAISCSATADTLGLVAAAGSELSLARTEVQGCGVGLFAQGTSGAAGSLALSEVGLSSNATGLDLAGRLDARLTNSTLEGNTRGLSAASGQEPLSLHLDGVKLLDNSDLGIAFEGAGVEAELLNCDLSENATGLWLGAGVQPGAVALHASRIGGNGQGIGLAAGTTLAAEGDWWGAASGPGGAGPGTGDSVPPGVSFSPWALDKEDTWEASLQDGRIFLSEGAPQDLMQALLDSAPAGSEVRLPAEERSLSAPLRLERPGVSLWLPAGTLLHGPQGCFSLSAGGVSVRGEAPGEATCRLEGAGPGLFVSGAPDQIGVSGLRFESEEGASGHAVVLGGTLDGVSLLDNRFEGLNGDAIRVAQGSTVQELAVHGNRFSQIKGFGLHNLGTGSISASANTWHGGAQGPGPGDVFGLEAASLTPWSYLDLSLAAPRAGHAAEGGQARVTLEAETSGVASLHLALSFDPQHLRLETISPADPFVLDEAACGVQSLEEANQTGLLALCLCNPAPAAGKVGLAELSFRVLPFAEGEEQTEVTWEDSGPFASGSGAGKALYVTSEQDLELTLDRVLPSVTGRVHAPVLLHPSVPGLVIRLGEGERLGYGPYDVTGTDTLGVYSFKDVVADRYPIELEAPGYLPVPFAAGKRVELGEDNPKVNPLVLLPGDVHPDASNRVDIFDASLLAEAINHKRYEQMRFCDLNGDTLLDAKDMELVQFSYGQDSLSATYYQAWEP
jgi:hypothetical protein